MRSVSCGGLSTLATVTTPNSMTPARELKGGRVQHKVRWCIDPFALDEAETLIGALRRDWGDAQANYDEFRFFTGLRRREMTGVSFYAGVPSVC